MTMNKQIFENIISILEKTAKVKSTSARFSDRRYKPIPFEKQNFHSLRSRASESSIAFVDGSNFELFGASNFSLQFIRTCVVVLKSNKQQLHEKNEFFCLGTSVNEGDAIRYGIQSFPDFLGELSIDSFDKTLATGNDLVSIKKTGELARSLSEITAATSVASALQAGDIIVMDGILEPKLTYEKEFLGRLFSKANEKGILLCGLAKTTDIFADSGNSIIAALTEIAPEGSWYYYPLVQNNNPEHPVEIYIVKLHDKSTYSFRFELINKQKDKVAELLSCLAGNSNDAIFLGYPYGLQLAHQFAKISKNEAGQLKTIFQSRAGKSWRKIEGLLRSSDAHDVLDRM